MAFKICSQCNEKVEEDWILCKYCNVPIVNNTTEVSSVSSEQPSRNYLKISVLVIVLIVIIIVLFGILK